MTQRFLKPLVQAFDNSGSLVSEARLRFFESGTTTPVDVYQDVDTTNPFSGGNEVDANTDGLFPDIYLRDGEYKVELLPKTGSTPIWTADPVNPLRDVSLGGRVNVKTLGARGNGSTDDTVAVKAAQILAYDLGAELYFPPGTYNVSETFYLKPNERWAGAGHELSVIRWTTALASGLDADPGTIDPPPQGQNRKIFGGRLDGLGFNGNDLVDKVFFMQAFDSWSVISCEFNKGIEAGVLLFGLRDAQGDNAPGDANFNYFEDCRFINTGRSDPPPVAVSSGAKLTGTDNAVQDDTARANTNVFVRCRFANNKDYGLWVERGSGTRVFGGTMTNSGLDGLRTDWFGGFYAITVEANDRYGVNLTDTGNTENNFVHFHSGGSNAQGNLSDLTDKNFVLGNRIYLPLPPTTALVERTTNQNIANNQWLTVDWQSQILDFGGFYDAVDPANSDRFIIPDDVGYVRVTAGVEFETNATGPRSIRIRKNGGSPPGEGRVSVLAASGEATVLNVSTAIIPVSKNDWITLEARQESGGPLDILSTNRTWLSIEGIAR
ncbi:MAG: glycosyl hydrolase family 28-related protein [Acidobacteriota bacterium]